MLALVGLSKQLFTIGSKGLFPALFFLCAVCHRDATRWAAEAADDDADAGRAVIAA